MFSLTIPLPSNLSFAFSRLTLPSTPAKERGSPGISTFPSFTSPLNFIEFRLKASSQSFPPGLERQVL